MNRGGMSKRIVQFAMTLVGHVRGGLGYVVIIASVLFAGLSGSAVADTAALGAILIPMMVERGYDKRIPTAIVSSAGIIAPIIPPSIPMILFGVVSGVSITQLFMGGIVPGLLIAVGLMLVWFYMSRRETAELPPRKSVKEVLTATKEAGWALLMPVIIIGGLRGGVFTPTEAGVIAVFYALFVGMFVYRNIGPRQLYDALIRSAKNHKHRHVRRVGGHRLRLDDHRRQRAAGDDGTF